MKTMFWFIASILVFASCTRPMYGERYIEKRLQKMSSPVVVISKGGTTIMVRDRRNRFYIFTVNSNASLMPKDTIK